MRRTSLVVLAVALASATACGSSSSGASPAAGRTPVAAVLAASTTTTQAGTAKVMLDVKSKAGDKAIDITGVGAFRLDGTLGSFAVTLNAGSGQPLTLEERTVGGLLYLKAPPLGDSYYSLKTDALLGTSLGQGTDPTLGLKLLKGAAEDVTVVGQEQVRGEQTTHYKGTYQLRKAVTALGGDLPKAFATQLTASGDTPVPFDAYVDDKGRLRKLVTVSTVTTQGRSVVSTATTELYDFGAPVDVQAPPADKVKDGTDLLKGLSG